MGLSRRAFLLGSATAVISPSILPAVAEPVPLWGPETLNAAPKLVKSSYVVGTPGEFDWIHIRASSAEKAWEIWCGENDMIEVDDDTGEENIPAMSPDCVISVPDWNGRNKISNADWLSINFGTTCEKCGTEVTGHHDSEIDNNVVFCCECAAKYLGKAPTEY